MANVLDALDPFQTSGLRAAWREFVALVRRFAADRPTRIVSVFVLCVTFGFIALYCVTTILGDTSPFAATIYGAIDLGLEGSISEKFNHGLAFSAALLFLLACAQARSRTVFLLFVLCSFFWIDDALQYHENVGGLIANTFPFEAPFGLRLQDFGELAAWSLAGLVLLALLIWALRSLRAGDCGLLVGAAVGFSALVLFGVLFDIIHVLLSKRIFTLIEDGGEMVAMSLFCIMALGWLRTSERFLRERGVG